MQIRSNSPKEKLNEIASVSLQTEAIRVTSAALIRFFALATSLLSSAPAGSSPTSSGVSLSLVRGYALANVRINGNGPFRMMIDTGATSTSLTPRTAARAGLTYDHRVVLATMAGEKTIPASSNGHIVVGAADESGMEIMVQEFPGRSKVNAEIDGILGQNFLDRSSYLINYQLKQMWFGEEADVRSAELPIAVNAGESDRRMVLPVTLTPETEPWHLVLDSGTNSLLLLCRDRCPPLSGLDPGTLLTSVGERAVQRGVLKRITVGPATIFAGEAFVMESSAPPGHQDGLLPTRWFSAIYVDSIHRIVRLAQSLAPRRKRE